MQRCFLSFLFFPLTRCLIGTALADPRELGGEEKKNSEDCWILRHYFNVPLMCQWIQIKIYQLFFFFQESTSCCSFLRNDSGAERSSADDTAHVYDSHYFSSPLNYPHVLFKGANVFTLAHTNLRYFSSILKPPAPILPPSHLARSDSTWCSACRFAARRPPSLAAVLLWSIVRGYQHNTRLNILEHIPSNPEHTVIRGNWASYHCDRTSTRHWFADLR